MTRHIARLLAALALVFISLPAYAQWQVNAHAVPLGRTGGGIGFAQAAAGASGTVFLGKGTTTDPAFVALSQDCTVVSTGVITCTKTNNVAFAASATTDATNASNIGSGTLPNARLDSEVQCIAGLTSAADKIAYYTGSGTCALADFSSAQRTYLTTSSSANLRGVLTDESGTGLAYFQGGDLGTPSAGVLTNATGLPVAGITASTSTALGVGSVELGHANDTTLARGSAGVLTVEGVTVPTISSSDTLSNKTLSAPLVTGTADVQQALKWSGDISPTQITAAQNDYAPTGFSTATTLRLSSDASRNITGLAGGAAGRVIVLHNVGTNNIVLTNQDAASTAANRFLFGGDMTLAADTSVTIKYDATSSRWRAITSPGAGGGGGGVTSVAIAGGTGISTSGTCTITTSGTCTVGLSTPVGVANGGTGLSSYTSGDLPYASGSTTISKLGIGSTGQNLVVSSSLPAWVYPTTLGTAVASTSGTSIAFTGIPSGVREVNVHFVGVSTSGTSNIIVQIGDSGGIETTGYTGGGGRSDSTALATFTNGLGVAGILAAASLNGTVAWRLENSTTSWVGVAAFSRNDTGAQYGSESAKTLSPGPLDRVTITTANGTDTFDAGEINISWRF